MPSHGVRVIAFGVDELRILMLSRIVPEGRESGDFLCIQAAGNGLRFGSAGDAIKDEHAGRIVEFCCLEIRPFHARETQAQIHYGARTHCPRRAKGDGSIVAAEEVGVAAGRSWNGGSYGLVLQAGAEAAEEGEILPEVIIDARVALVAGRNGGRGRLVVVGCTGKVRIGEGGEHFSREWRDLIGRYDPVGIRGSIVRIDDGSAEVTLLLRGGGQRRVGESLGRAAKPLVVGKEEEFVLTD